METIANPGVGDCVFGCGTHETFGYTPRAALSPAFHANGCKKFCT